MKQTIPPLTYLCRRRPLGLDGERESSVDNHLEVPDSKGTIVKGPPAGGGGLLVSFDQHCPSGQEFFFLT